MADNDDQQQLNNTPADDQQVSKPGGQREAAKSSAAKAISEVESAPKEGVSKELDSQQTDSETQETQPESDLSESSGALRTDEPDQGEEPIEEESVEQPKSSSPSVPGARWYVIHTYSGHENKVAATLKQRIESEKLEDKILEILVPMQDKIEIRGGKKATVKEKIFPGYILVKMVLDEMAWLAVRTTPGVTSFVGIGNKPTPITDKEVETIVHFTQNAEPVFKQVFSVSDTVKIVDGPFADFIGKVDNVDEEKGKVKVLVSIFGRETPVELDFLQVQKI